MVDRDAIVAEPTVRYAWLWDVDLDNAGFLAILRGAAVLPGMDQDWAMLRLIEYAPCREIRRLLPADAFLTRWPALRNRIRSNSRREGMEYFTQWTQGRRAVRV